MQSHNLHSYTNSFTYFKLAEEINKYGMSCYDIKQALKWTWYI